MTYDLAAIRARLDDPMSVASALGLVDGPRSFRRLSRGIQVRCPAHAERTPSCAIAATGTGVVWFCHGCKEGGDVFDLIAAVAGLDRERDFRNVAAHAAQIAGVTEDVPVPAYTPPPLPPEPERLDDDTFDAIASVIARLCPVHASPDAAGYLSERGLACAAGALAALPGAGSDQDRVVSAIVAEVGRDAWDRSGLAGQRGGFLFPAHRLVAFWRGPGVDGVVQTIQRRLVRAARPDDRFGKYVFATRRSPRWPYGIEHAEALGAGGEVAFVEGFLDTLAMRALCAREGRDRLVLGLPGTSGWRQSWAGLAAGRVAVVATDADEAGERAAEQIATDLAAAGALDVQRAVPAGACDWAELLAGGGVAA